MLCIITALHGGPVGDPLQIYADRFSGHYAVTAVLGGCSGSSATKTPFVRSSSL